jgi:hypothetical protein
MMSRGFFGDAVSRGGTSGIARCRVNNDANGAV